MSSRPSPLKSPVANFMRATSQPSVAGRAKDGVGAPKPPLASARNVKSLSSPLR